MVVQHDRRTYKIPGFALDSTGKRQSEQLGDNVFRVLQSKAGSAGIHPTLRAYLESLPAHIRHSLAHQSIIDAGDEAKTLVEQLADYGKAMEHKGTTPLHIHKTTDLITKAAVACGFTKLADVTPAKLRGYLAKRREPRARHDDHGDLLKDAAGKAIMRPGISARRHNATLTAWGGFFRWCIRERRAFENPIVNVGRLNERLDRRHVRRALEPAELRTLLDTTAKGPDLGGMSGTDRALIYLSAMETGLRLTELKTLTRDCFDLDEGVLTVKAMNSKHRKTDTLLLRPQLVEAQRPQLATKAPAALVFDMPNRHTVLRAFYADLRAAGIAQVDESDKVVDFHALRHSFITALVQSGAAVKEAQELARHSTPLLTYGRYAHVTLNDTMRALNRMPDYSAPAAESKKTGTNDATPLPMMPTPQNTGVYSGHNLGPFETNRDKPKDRTENNQSAKKPMDTGLLPMSIGDAGGGSRTHTSLRTLDFESSASASSATPAMGFLYQISMAEESEWGLG